jgi:hypothetical protein
MSIELSDGDVRKFAETASRMLEQSAGQIAQLRQSFPKITDADIQAMSDRIKADTGLGYRQEPIDVAIYYLALHTIICANAQAAIAELGTTGTPATLHYLLLMLLPNCANIVNALTLLTRGGLATQLHVEEMQGVARGVVARAGGNKKHEKMNEAKAWVQQQWKDHGGTYASKAEFARHYVKQVRAEHDGLKVEEKTIRESWLAPSAIDH